MVMVDRKFESSCYSSGEDAFNFQRLHLQNVSSFPDTKWHPTWSTEKGPKTLPNVPLLQVILK